MGEGGTELQELVAAAGDFVAGDESFELKSLRVVIDSLEGKFAAEAVRAKAAGDHLVGGHLSAVSWLARSCSMSATSAADRLCVGEQLQSLPKVAEALRSGEIGYQSAALLCHLRDQLGDKKDLFDEDEMLGLAVEHTVKDLRFLCRYARHVADPDGFHRDAEDDFTRRRLDISQFGDGMYAIDAILDPVGGAAVKTALESLARRLGPDDERSHKQHMADSLVEAMDHAMDQGTLPRRNGVKPHLTMTTTLEALKQEVGAPAADLEQGMPVSMRSAERIACDCTMTRVLMADSMVVDVGRATRTVSAPTRRALGRRDRGCRFPGCDRQVSWSTPHHIEFWARGGPTDLPNLLLLCYFHHRLVHDGGWQVVKVGKEIKFIPPEHVVMRRARGPGRMRWAA